MNPYEVLGVAKNATMDEIKKAHRKLATKHHPDKGGETDAFQRIQHAFEILSDPERRKRFDEFGDASNPKDLKSQMLNELAGLMLVVIDQVDIERNDIVHVMKSRINNEISKGQQVMSNLGQQIQKREKVIKRLTLKDAEGGQNVMLNMLEASIGEVRQRLSQVSEAIDRMAQMREILEEYQYKIDELPMRTATSRYFTIS